MKKSCRLGATFTEKEENLWESQLVSMNPYLQWVQTRAIQLKMPYPRQRLVPLKEPTYIFMCDAKKLQIALTKAQRERNAWKNKYQVVSLENTKIQSQLREKDDLIEILE